MKVWIVGQLRDRKPWEFQGVFSSQEKAVAACRNERYFIGPAVVDAEIPDDSRDPQEWGAYFPLEGGVI